MLLHIYSEIFTTSDRWWRGDAAKHPLHPLVLMQPFHQGTSGVDEVVSLKLMAEVAEKWVHLTVKIIMLSLFTYKQS